MNDAPLAPPVADGGTPAVIVARGLVKRFVGGDGMPLEILSGVELEIPRGESIAIVGESGAGKSTLLHLLGGLDRPTQGQVWIAGESIADANDLALARIRNRNIGFVFQFHHLLREFTALENVMMPQLIAGEKPRTARDRARELLEQVGLQRRLTHKPTQLSGGEQQRVAVARALVNRPLALLADEPSGNLDPQTSERLHGMLFDISARHGTAMVLVTHNRALAARADRVLRLAAGGLVPVDIGAEAVAEATRS